MNPLLQNRFTYQEEGPELETNDLPSMTQPDEVLSIAEMLSRHARGIPLSGASRDPVYYPEELGYVPDVERLDLTELHELAEHMTEKRKNIEKEITQREKEEREKKAAADKKRADMEKFFDSQQKNGGSASPTLSKKEGDSPD